MIDFDQINLENTINSGQVFLWKKIGSFWYGVNGQDVLKINEANQVKSYQSHKVDFFRKKDDMRKIIQSISKDEITSMAIKKYLGLRILRQDPFQCLISFIVSSNSNIQKIQSNLKNLTKKLGKKVEFDKNEFYLFPDSKSIENSTVEQINSCGLGYRSKFVFEAAKMVESKQLDFEYLKKCNYQKAKKIIQTVPGVGSKVADCILLFSLDKLDAFPIDRWMVRVLEKYYLNKFKLKTKSITEKQYQELHEKIIDYFGPFAGYTQQFLFKMERDNHQKKWL